MGIGANLKRLREAAGMTQETLGRAAKVKQSDISKWEKKGQIPTIKPLLRLATALGVSVDVLLDGVDPSYDGVSKTEQQNLTERVTSSGSGSDVQKNLTPDREAHATAHDRLSQSSSAFDAEVLRGVRELEALERIIEHADAIAQLRATIGRLHPGSPDPRGDEAGSPPRDRDVRKKRAGARRGAR